MEFFNATNFDDFIDKDVHVIITSDSNICDTLPSCHAFLRKGKLFIDLIPQTNKRYVVEVPEDSGFSINDGELAMGRYGIIVRAESHAGILIRDLLQQKSRLQQGKQ